MMLDERLEYNFTPVLQGWEGRKKEMLLWLTEDEKEREKKVFDHLSSCHHLPSKTRVFA